MQNTYSGNIKAGQRIEMMPHTDLWMMGARYGNVVKVGRKYVTIKLDKLKEFAAQLTAIPPPTL